MAVISAAEAGHPNIVTFLDLIAFSEGTSTSPATQCGGYDVIVNGHDGRINLITDFSDHPFANGRQPVVVTVDEKGDPALESTASGRYQVMRKIWHAYKAPLGLPDFAPHSQDLIGRRLISDCNALHLLIGSEIAAAIYACRKEWASFPGNDYGQGGGKSMDTLLAKFQELRKG